MKDLLFLVHRIPFPPNKGDKVRSFHFLEFLRHRYRVHLGTFIDHPEDWQYVPKLRELCEELFVTELSPPMARLRSLSGLLSGKPLTLNYYRDHGMRKWVDKQIAEYAIDRILVFSSAMAQYAIHHTHPGRQCVIDFVDVDSDKWRQYADKKRWPLSWLYGREGRTLRTYEYATANQMSASLFATQEEVALFRRHAPTGTKQATCVNNGVDTEYFSPDVELENPFPRDVKALVFTGAMDYWPNVDAVCWFARAVLPEILRRCPDVRFYVVGARPTPQVRALEKRNGIAVTGTVKDVRPYILHARACVAPLRVARGVQNKVLEALAMAKPLLATSPAMEGIKPNTSIMKFVTDEPDQLSALAVQVLIGERDSNDFTAARAWVIENFNWNKNLERLSDLLEETTLPEASGKANFNPQAQRAPANP